MAAIRLGRISGRQLVLLVWLVGFISAILYIPSALASRLQQDSWVAFLFGGVLIAPMWIMIVTLGRVFPGLSVMEWSRELLGEVGGRLLGLVFLAFFTYVAAVLIRMGSELFVIAFMPETPLWVFILMGVFVGGYAAWHGLESIARATEILAPFVFLLALGLLLGLGPSVDLKLLQPFFVTQPEALLRASLIPAAFYGEALVFVVFLPALYKPGAAWKEGLLGLALAAFFLTALSLLMLGIFGSLELGRLTFAALELARTVQFGRFVERIEAVVLGVWVMGGFLKMGLFYHAVVISLAEWLHRDNYRDLVVPVGIIVMIATFLVAPNYLYLFRFTTTTWPFLALTVEIGLPVLLLLVAVGKKRKGRGDAERAQ